MVVDQDQAIAIAEDYLNRLLPNGFPPSDISARYVSVQDIVNGRKELEKSFGQCGQSADESLEALFDPLGLSKPHWAVLFLMIDKPNTASTTTPTIVRVDEASGHAELAD